MPLGEEFQGLPMENLIGAPLNAACNANVNLAKATAEFIETIGFVQGEDGKSQDVRTAKFAFDKPVIVTDAQGNQTFQKERIDIEVPLLSVVQIPSLKVDTVDITFDMEVKTSEKSSETSDKTGEMSGGVKVGWGPFSAHVDFKGSVSAHKENTRSTDKSAKYHVEVKALDKGMPEGLARVLDIMNQAAAPMSISASKDTKQGGGE